MAIEIGDAILRLGVDTTDLDRELASVQAKMRNFGQRAGEVGRSLTMLSAPLVAMVGASVKAAISFEDSFAGIRKTVDATEQEFEDISTAFRNLAKIIPVSVNELNRIGEAAGQLGIKTEDIVSFSRVMADLGATTNMASAQAATALARLANITGMASEDYDRLGSTIVELGNNLATTEAEIVDMSLRLAGAGQIIGMTEAQILGLAGALSSVGIRAQLGGSAISRVMVDIANEVAKGGERLATFAKVAGMSIDDFRRAFEVDAAGALVSFTEGLGRVSEEGGNVFGVLEDLELGEVRVRDALLRAAGAGDLFRESLALGSKAWEENTALTEEAEKRYATSGSQLKILMNRLQDVAITLGDLFVPMLVDLADALKPILEGISEWIERNPGWAKVIGITSVAVMGLGVGLMGLSMIMPGLTGMFGLLAKAVHGFNLRLAVTYALIVPIVAALAALGYGMKKQVDSFNEGIDASAELKRSYDAINKAMAKELVATGRANDIREAKNMLLRREIDDYDQMYARIKKQIEAEEAEVVALDDITASHEDLQAQAEETYREWIEGAEEAFGVTADGAGTVTVKLDKLSGILQATARSVIDFDMVTRSLVDLGLNPLAAAESVVALLSADLRGQLEELTSQITGGSELLDIMAASGMSVADMLSVLHGLIPDVTDDMAGLNTELDIMAALGPDIVKGLEAQDLAARALTDTWLAAQLQLHKFTTDAASGFGQLAREVEESVASITGIGEALEYVTQKRERLFGPPEAQFPVSGIVDIFADVDWAEVRRKYGMAPGFEQALRQRGGPFQLGPTELVQPALSELPVPINVQVYLDGRDVGQGIGEMASNEEQVPGS